MKIELRIINKKFYIEKSNDPPLYSTPGSAAMDLVCTEYTVLYPGETKLIPTGLAIWVGSDLQGIAGLILPRSGLGTKGLVLANTIGLIDEDYQGELKVSLLNRSRNKIELKQGDRFAQLMFIPVLKAHFKVVEEFSSKTGRNTGSFGSTGDNNAIRKEIE